MNSDDTALIAIDIQEKFLPVISNLKDVIINAKKIITAFKMLKMPMLLTEQYPTGLGKTVKEIASLTDIDPIEKVHFSCFGEKKFVKELEPLEVKNLVLLGIEMHVCVLNTAIDARDRGYTPYVVVDATGSRSQRDYDISLARMMQEKIFLTTTEMLLFQLLTKAGTPEFRAISKIIK
jgi:nicotinamidase-related amidase